MSQFDDRQLRIDTIIKACQVLHPIFRFEDSHGITDTIHLIAFSVNTDLTIEEMHYVFKNVVEPKEVSIER